MMHLPEAAVRQKYKNITETLIDKHLTVTTMESCTAGQIASLITDTEGSSAVLKGAFVTYSNEAKILQGVPEEIITGYGVYSLQTAEAMAGVCREIYRADFGIGVTGSFGNPDPANSDSVPGEVYCAIARAEGNESFFAQVPKELPRYAGKLYVADIVADWLLELLKES